MKRIFPKNTSILSPRVVVRSSSSWKYRIAVILVSCLALFSLAWGMFEAGKQSRNSLVEDVSDEKFDNHLPYDPAVCRQTKRQQLCTEMGELIHQVQIHSTTNEDLLKQIRALTYENDQLKEKMVFFQHLMAGNSKSGVSIYQFQLKETETSGKYRFSLTLIQGGKRPNDFRGRVRFHITLSQGDKTKIVPVMSGESKVDFLVDFKSLYRLEDTFKVPEGIFVKNIQAQIYENNASKALLTQTTQPIL